MIEAVIAVILLGCLALGLTALALEVHDDKQIERYRKELRDAVEQEILDNLRKK